MLLRWTQPENMLFATKDKVLIKLIDFGFAKMDNTVLQTPIGTAAYVGASLFCCPLPSRALLTLTGQHPRSLAASNTAKWLTCGRWAVCCISC